MGMICYIYPSCRLEQVIIIIINGIIITCILNTKNEKIKTKNQNQTTHILLYQYYRV